MALLHFLLNTSSSNYGTPSIPLWLYLVLAVVPSGIAFALYRIEVRRFHQEREADAERQVKVQRELDRREDQLWGYIDSQGIRHIGVVDTVNELKKNLGDFIEEFQKYVGDSDSGKG
jgi:hypothetical protein